MVALYGFRFRCGIFELRFATRATLFFRMKHRQHCSDKLLSEVVQHDRTISGSYDWLRLGRGGTDRQCLLRYPEAVAYGD